MDSAPAPISQASRDPLIGPSESLSNIPNAFAQMMHGTPTEQRKGIRDRCNRLVPTYNRNYNPYKPPPEDRRPDYFPYTSGEPLHDDRPIIIAWLPRKHVIAGASKRKRTTWVW
ncbi:uncharacterized protein K444DRAFT_614225, partial [Hyaloscypha bicolor E]